MAIDPHDWSRLMTSLDAVTADLAGTDPDDLDTLRDALTDALDAVNAEGG